MEKHDVRAFDEHAMIVAFIAVLLVAMGVALGLALVFLPAMIAVPIFYVWAVSQSVSEHARTHQWRPAASPWPSWIAAAVAAIATAFVAEPMLDSEVSVALVVGALVALAGPAVAALLAWRRDGRTLASDLLACSPLVGQAMVAAAAFGFESGKLAHLATVAMLDGLLTPWALLLVSFWIVFPILQNAGAGAASQPAAYRTATWLVAVVGSIALLRHAGLPPSGHDIVPVVGITTIVLVPILAFTARRLYRVVAFSIASIAVACLVSQAEFWPEEVALWATAVVLAAGPAFDTIRRIRGSSDRSVGGDDGREAPDTVSGSSP